MRRRSILNGNTKNQPPLSTSRRRRRVLQRKSKKCTKILNSLAQLLFFSLNLLFGDRRSRCRHRCGLLQLLNLRTAATPSAMSIEKQLMFFIRISRLYPSIDSAGVSVFQISSALHVKTTLISKKEILIDIAPSWFMFSKQR